MKVGRKMFSRLTCKNDGMDFIHSTVNASNLEAHSFISSYRIQLIENGKLVAFVSESKRTLLKSAAYNLRRVS